jgi:chorismate mutase
MSAAPDTDARRAEALLSDHRASIDRLDAILVYTLAERFKHTQAVGRLKAEHDLPPSDPAREARQIERLERWRARPTSTRNLPRNSSASSSPR